MGTTPEEPAPIKGVVARAGDQFVIITEQVKGVAYGDRMHKRSMWPLLLLCVAAIAIVLDVPVAGFISLILLALWIGASH